MRKDIVIKICSVCKKKKKITEFHRSNRYADGRNYACKQCRKNRQRDYHNRLRVREYDNILIPSSKKCYKCGKTKPSEEFGKCVSNKDYLQGSCKSCHKKQMKQYTNKLKLRNFNEFTYPKTKKCSECKKNRPLKYFGKYGASKDGVRSVCKKCRHRYQKDHKEYFKEYSKQYQKDHKENLKEYYRQYREKNAEKISCRQKKYQKKNKEKIRTKQSIYYKKNKDRLNQKKKEYSIKNSIKIKKYRRDHYQKNKLEISKKAKIYRKNHLLNLREKSRNYRINHKAERNKYEKHKRKNDIEYRITSGLRNRLNKVLKSQNVKKLDHTLELLGCSIRELVRYIGSKFDSKMSWENYGQSGWHIDHIKPCVAFNLMDLEEQKKCFHYTNLQPLWWYDNLSKNSYYNSKLIRKNK